MKERYSVTSREDAGTVWWLVWDNIANCSVAALVGFPAACVLARHYNKQPYVQGREDS